MATKRAAVSYHGPGLRFVGGTGSGHVVAFDDEAGGTGPRPTEVMLSALAACTAMDVISILQKKRQPVESYRVRVEGQQQDEHPRVFTEIHVVHEVRGGRVDPAAVRRAVELSASRYCAISATLATGATRISHWYVVLGDSPSSDDVGEVLVTGPFAQPQPQPDAPPRSAIPQAQVPGA
jgi:putative redox protein